MSEEFQNYIDWLNLDETEAQGGGGTPPEVGTHKLEVVSFEKKPSSKNTPQVRVSFKVTSDGESKGRRISGWYTLDAQATEFEKGRLKQLLVATGLPTNKFNLDTLVGKQLIADVTERMIDDKKNPGKKMLFRGISEERAA